jgi:chorismate-pyruvate lyase
MTASRMASVHEARQTTASLDDPVALSAVPAHADVPATSGRGLAVPPPGLLQRILLTTDGNVSRILENYAGEAIVAVKLDQIASPAGDACHALELEPHDERLTRRVLLRGGQSGRSLLYAETLVATGRLHPVVRAGLLSTSEPIGRLLTAARLETFRDILSSGVTRDAAVAARFGIAESEDLFVRTYRIVSGGHPIMLITEMFPTTWFC